MINPTTPPTFIPTFPPSAAALLVELATEALEDTSAAPVPAPVKLVILVLEATLVKSVVELATLVLDTFLLQLIEVSVGKPILGALSEIVRE
jgi:hypothetical protein